jgi:hypothetical protein
MMLVTSIRISQYLRGCMKVLKECKARPCKVEYPVRSNERHRLIVKQRE